MQHDELVGRQRSQSNSLSVLVREFNLESFPAVVSMDDRTDFTAAQFLIRKLNGQCY